MGPPPQAFPGPFPASPAPCPRATILSSQRGPGPLEVGVNRPARLLRCGKLPNALLLSTDVIVLCASLWPPAGATQGLSHLGLSGIKLPPAPLWGAGTFPCPGQQGAAASQWRGRQVCSAGGTRPFFTVGCYTTHQWMRQDTRHRPVSWLSARGGGLDEERRWRARLAHPRRWDTQRHLPAGHHMDASDTGKGFPVPTHTAALGSHDSDSVPDALASLPWLSLESETQRKVPKISC